MSNKKFPDEGTVCIRIERIADIKVYAGIVPTQYCQDIPCALVV